MSNDQDGFEQLPVLSTQNLVAVSLLETHLILKPSGACEKCLWPYAQQAGWSFSLVTPKQGREWAQGVGYRAKTDALDAQFLAHFGDQQQALAQ